jgi:DNA-binding transcriptional LysR family regulator
VRQDEERTVPVDARKVHDNPSEEQLRRFTTEMPQCRITEFDNLNVQTRVTSRSAGSTYVVTEDPSLTSGNAMKREEFERISRLQDDYLRKITRKRIAPPRHHVPSSADYAEAVRLGLGWGMLPRHQYADLEAAGDLVVFDTARHIDVPLYWQQWTLQTPALDAIAAAIRQAARTALD